MAVRKINEYKRFSGDEDAELYLEQDREIIEELLKATEDLKPIIKRYAFKFKSATNRLTDETLKRLERSVDKDNFYNNPYNFLNQLDFREEHLKNVLSDLSK